MESEPQRKLRASRFDFVEVCEENKCVYTEDVVCGGLAIRTEFKFFAAILGGFAGRPCTATVCKCQFVWVDSDAVELRGDATTVCTLKPRKRDLTKYAKAAGDKHDADPDGDDNNQDADKHDAEGCEDGDPCGGELVIPEEGFEDKIVVSESESVSSSRSGLSSLSSDSACGSDSDDNDDEKMDEVVVDKKPAKPDGGPGDAIAAAPMRCPRIRVSYNSALNANAHETGLPPREIGTMRWVGGSSYTFKVHCKLHSRKICEDRRKCGFMVTVTDDRMWDFVDEKLLEFYETGVNYKVGDDFSEADAKDCRYHTFTMCSELGA